MPGGAPMVRHHAALVELCPALAVQMDAAGKTGPRTRLTGTYLTALRTLASVSDQKGTPTEEL